MPTKTDASVFLIVVDITERTEYWCRVQMFSYFLLLLILISTSPTQGNDNTSSTPKVLQILPTSTSNLAIVQLNSIRYLLQSRIIVGASFVPSYQTSSENSSAATDNFSDDELPIVTKSLQTAGLYASCTRFYTALHTLHRTVPCQTAMQALLLGGGGGSVAMYLDRRNVTVDIVEKQPEVIELATKYNGLNLKNGGTIIINEPLVVLQQKRKRRKKYNLIILQDGNNNNKEKYLTLIQKHWLTTDGVLVLNIIGSAVQGNPTYSTTEYTFRLLRAHFKHVRCYRDMPLDQFPDRISNIACYATNHQASILFTLPDSISKASKKKHPTSWYTRNFPKWVVFAADEGVEEEIIECVSI